MNKLIVLCAIFVLVLTQSLIAQNKVLQGKVCTFNNIPLIGASIQVKSTNQLIKTDSLGLFTVSVQKQEKLKFSAKGFFTKNVKVQDTTKFIFVNLKLKKGKANQEIARNSGYVRDINKLYALASQNRNTIDFSQYTDIYDIIRGRFPGVEIVDGDIVVRGSLTLISSNAALLVVDNVIVDQDFFSNIQPAEISSINVLKDSGAAEYGARGANGVVVVRTILKE